VKRKRTEMRYKVLALLLLLSLSVQEVGAGAVVKTGKVTADSLTAVDREVAIGDSLVGPYFEPSRLVVVDSASAPFVRLDSAAVTLLRGEKVVVTDSLLFSDGSSLTSGSVGTAVSVSSSADAYVRADSDDNGSGTAFVIVGTDTVWRALQGGKLQVAGGDSDSVLTVNGGAHFAGSALVDGNLEVSGELQAAISFVDSFKVRDSGSGGYVELKPDITSRVTIGAANGGTGILQFVEHDSIRYYLSYVQGSAGFSAYSSNTTGTGTGGYTAVQPWGTKDWRFYGGVSTDNETAPTSGILSGGIVAAKRTGAGPTLTGTTSAAMLEARGSTSSAVQIGSGGASTGYAGWIRSAMQANQATAVPLLLNPSGGWVSVRDSTLVVSDSVLAQGSLTLKNESVPGALRFRNGAGGQLAAVEYDSTARWWLFYNEGDTAFVASAEDSLFRVKGDVAIWNNAPTLNLVDTDGGVNERSWALTTYTTGGGSYPTIGLHGVTDAGAIRDTAFYFYNSMLGSRVLRTPGDFVAGEGIAAGRYSSVAAAAPYFTWYENPAVNVENAQYNFGMNEGKLYLADINSGGTISDTVLTVVPTVGAGHSYTAFRTGNVYIGSSAVPAEKLDVGGDVRIGSNHPSLYWYNSGGGADAKLWGMHASGSYLYLTKDTDAKAATDTLMRWDRTNKAAEVYGARPALRFYDTGGTSNEHMYEWAGAGERLSLLMLSDAYAVQDSLLTAYRNSGSTYGWVGMPRMVVGSHNARTFTGDGDIQIYDATPTLELEAQSSVQNVRILFEDAIGNVASLDVPGEASGRDVYGTLKELNLSGKLGVNISYEDTVRLAIDSLGLMWRPGLYSWNHHGPMNRPQCFGEGLTWPGNNYHLNTYSVGSSVLEENVNTSSSSINDVNLWQWKQYARSGSDTVNIAGMYFQGRVESTDISADWFVNSTFKDTTYAIGLMRGGLFIMDETREGTAPDHDFTIMTVHGISELDGGEATFTVSSDRAKKKNIFPLFDSIVLALREAYEEFDIARWDWKTEEDGEGRHVGPIAQEFAPVSTLLHGVEGDTTMFQSADMTMANTILIQDLLKRVQALEERVAELESTH